MKKCAKCGRRREFVAFWKCSTTQDGLQKQCKDCQREGQRARSKTAAYQERHREWVNANPEKVRASRNRWAMRNAARFVEWQRANPDKVREMRRSQTERLTDGCVKRYISRSGIPAALIPADLVEAKRQHLLIQRQLKESK